MDGETTKFGNIEEITADLERPELIEGLSSRRFDPRLLINAKVSEYGEIVETDEGQGQLIKIPLLEGFSWNMPANLILRNPNQPREYFNEAKMLELQQTIGSSGQGQDIKVIPIKLLETGQIKMFILDGERRYRVMTKRLAYTHINAQITFEANTWNLDAQAFIANESRAPHNAIERAKHYKRLLNRPNPKLMRKMTISELADHLGTSAVDISTHLKLLELPEAIQLKIIDGTLPKTGALAFGRVIQNLGDDYEAALLARQLLRQLYGDEDEKDEGKKTQEGEGETKKDRRITKRKVLLATHAALREEGKKDIAETMEAQRVALHIKGVAHKAENLASELLAADTTKVVEALRNRSMPPEVVIDAVRIAIATLTAALKIIELSTKEDPLPEVPSKPSFSEHLTNNLTSPESLITERQGTLAKILAEESDTTQNILTSKELSEITDMTTTEIGANIRYLRPFLAELGIKIAEYKGRQLNNHGEYTKSKAYRMEWMLPPDIEAKLKAEAKQKLLIDTQAEAIRLKLATLTSLGVDPRRTSKGSRVPTVTEETIPALEIDPEKPPFSQTIETNQSTFKNDLRLKIAQTLAKEAETSQKTLSAEKIGELLGESSITISNSIRYLNKELDSLGIELQVFEIIQKNQNEKEYRVHAYRLAWKKEETSTEEALPPEKPTKEPSPEIIQAEVARRTASLQAEVDKLRKQLARTESERDDVSARFLSIESVLGKTSDELSRLKLRLVMVATTPAPAPDIRPKQVTRAAAPAPALISIPKPATPVPAPKFTPPAPIPQPTQIPIAPANIDPLHAEKPDHIPPIERHPARSFVEYLKNNEEILRKNRSTLELARKLANIADTTGKALTTESIAALIGKTAKQTESLLEETRKFIRDIGLTIDQYAMNNEPTKYRLGWNKKEQEAISKTRTDQPPTHPTPSPAADKQGGVPPIKQDHSRKFTDHVDTNRSVFNSNQKAYELAKRLSRISESSGTTLTIPSIASILGLRSEDIKPLIQKTNAFLASIGLIIKEYNVNYELPQYRLEWLSPAEKVSSTSPSRPIHPNHTPNPTSPPPTQLQPPKIANPNGQASIDSLRNASFQTRDALNGAIIQALIKNLGGDSSLTLGKAREIRDNLGTTNTSDPLNTRLQEFISKMSRALNRAVNGALPNNIVKQLLEGIK